MCVKPMDVVANRVYKHMKSAAEHHNISAEHHELAMKHMNSMVQPAEVKGRKKGAKK